MKEKKLIKKAGSNGFDLYEIRNARKLEEYLTKNKEEATWMAEDDGIIKPIKNIDALHVYTDGKYYNSHFDGTYAHEGDEVRRASKLIGMIAKKTYDKPTIMRGEQVSALAKAKMSLLPFAKREENDYFSKEQVEKMKNRDLHIWRKLSNTKKDYLVSAM